MTQCTTQVDCTYMYITDAQLANQIISVFYRHETMKHITFTSRTTPN